MPSNFKNFLNEAVDPAEKEMLDAAKDRYQQIAGDLPDEGRDGSAIDVIGDFLFDTFRNKYPKANFLKIAQTAMKAYGIK